MRVPLLLTVQVWRAGRQYKQSFSRGVPQGPLEESAAEEVDATACGTQVRLEVWGLRTRNHVLSSSRALGCVKEVWVGTWPGFTSRQVTHTCLNYICSVAQQFAFFARPCVTVPPHAHTP